MSPVIENSPRLLLGPMYPVKKNSPRLFHSPMSPVIENSPRLLHSSIMVAGGLWRNSGMTSYWLMLHGWVSARKTLAMELCLSCTNPSTFNSIAPGRCGSNLELVIFKLLSKRVPCTALAAFSGPQFLKNHWNWIIVSGSWKNLEMFKIMENHSSLVQSLKQKSLNSEIDIALID